MLREMEVDNNNIGSAIQYFRETYHISQSRLCKGIMLCGYSIKNRSRRKGCKFYYVRNAFGTVR